MRCYVENMSAHPWAKHHRFSYDDAVLWSDVETSMQNKSARAERKVCTEAEEQDTVTALIDARSCNIKNTD